MARSVLVTYRISPDPVVLAGAAAELFASVATAAVSARGKARIAVSGGTTPKGMFAALADRTQPYFAKVPWTHIELYWVDERCVPPTDAESNYRMTHDALLTQVPLPATQVHRMEGEIDPQMAAAKYEALLRTRFELGDDDFPVFDLVLLGMGDDGHTASLFPHTQALSNTTDLVAANHVPQKDTWRITLTAPVINNGREVVFLIENANKAQVLSDVMQGPYDPESKPSQLVRPVSGKLTLLLDAAAASKLPVTVGEGKLELS